MRHFTGMSLKFVWTVSSLIFDVFLKENWKWNCQSMIILFCNYQFYVCWKNKYPSESYFTLFCKLYILVSNIYEMMCSHIFVVCWKMFTTHVKQSRQKVSASWPLDHQFYQRYERKRRKTLYTVLHVNKELIQNK